MSGFEAVFGLVLGIFPLVVSGLEHWKDGYVPARRFLDFEELYRKTLEDVKDEHLNFRLHLKELLLPLVADQGLATGDMEALMANMDDDAWAKEMISKAMANRLGEACERYLRVLQSMQKLLLKFLKMLDYDKAELQGKMGNDLNAIATAPPRRRLMRTANQAFLRASAQIELQRIKFSFNKSELEELLFEIRDHNRKLDMFLQKSDRIALIQTTNTVVVPRTAVKSLLSYWQHADCVYALFMRCWTCARDHRHCAHLWLQHRRSPDFEFRMLVLNTQSKLQGSPIVGWTQQGLQIQLEEAALQHISVPGVLPKPTAPLPLQSAQRKLKKDPKPAARVKIGIRFQDPSAPASAFNATSAPPPAKKTALTLASQQSTAAEIHDMCEKLSLAGMSAACIGSMTDSSLGRKYTVFAQPEQKIVASEVSLWEVLQSAHRPRMVRTQRFATALAIASSHLKLHSTSWARKQWTALDIRFPRSTTDPRDIMFDRPYVSADFEATIPHSQHVPKPTEHSFASLGIILLELLFGHVLDEHELWQQSGFGQNQRNPIFRQMVAGHWAQSVEGEAGPNYAAAVSWCLNDSPSTLQGDRWRRDLAEKVVLPLEKCSDWIQPQSDE